jgi:predicted PurR-regulated permease PerM
MELKNYNTYFFLLILAAVSAVTFFIFKPFLTAIAVAAVLAVIFHRPYQFFLKLTKNNKIISSLLTSILVVMIVIIPLFVMAGLVINEVDAFYKSYLAEGGSFVRIFPALVENINKAPLVKELGLGEVFGRSEFVSSVKNLSQGVLMLIQKTYETLAGFVLWVFAMFFALYYFLIDGERAVRKILYLSPLKNSHEKIIIDKFISIVRATIKGVIVVGLLQGTMGGIMFAIAGVPSPVVWGIVIFIFSFVPVLGTGIIWFPAGIIMLLIGNVWQGVFILSVGVGLISTFDNLLRPKLVGSDSEMHPLLVLFATLGGLAVFGITGFIIGPVLVAMCLALWGIYAVEFKEQLQEYNN